MICSLATHQRPVMLSEASQPILFPHRSSALNVSICRCFAASTSRPATFFSQPCLIKGTNAPISAGGTWEDGESMTNYTGEKKFLKRVLLATAAIVGLLAFAATPRASAADYDGCQKRIYKADHKLHEAVERHGWNSRQADHARHELRE